VNGRSREHDDLAVAVEGWRRQRRGPAVTLRRACSRGGPRDRL